MCKISYEKLERLAKAMATKISCRNYRIEIYYITPMDKDEFIEAYIHFNTYSTKQYNATTNSLKNLFPRSVFDFVQEDNNLEVSIFINRDDKIINALLEMTEEELELYFKLN